MPDVISLAPADVRMFVALDVHKLSILAATLPPSGGRPEIHRIETTEKAIRRFVSKLGGPDGLAVCYEAGPGGFGLWRHLPRPPLCGRLLTSIGVACDVVANGASFWIARSRSVAALSLGGCCGARGSAGGPKCGRGSLARGP
jgi:hypothetical protein